MEKAYKLEFEKDILEGNIKLPVQYLNELNEIKDNFRKENEEEIILDIIEDTTVPEVHLSIQAGELRNYSRSIKQDYPNFSDNKRRSLVHSAYRKIENNKIPEENKDFIENYVNKQLIPRELKLNKVLSLHTVNKIEEREIIYEIQSDKNPSKKVSLEKRFYPAKTSTEKDKIHILVNFSDETIDLGEYSNDEETCDKTKLLERVQYVFGDRKEFWEEIDSKYNNFFQFQIVSGKNIKKKIAPNERTFKNSRNELLDALYNKRFIAISDYSSDYVINHNFKLITVNDIGETVCLEVSIRKFCLLENINDDDWAEKFDIRVKVLDGETLNDIIERSTRKNTSTRIFKKEFLGSITVAWDINNNRIDDRKEYELIEGIRSAVNATIGCANKGFDDIIDRTVGDDFSNIDFVYFENEKGDVKKFIKFEQNEEQKNKYEISIIKKVNNQESCVAFKAEKAGGKFVFDYDEYPEGTDREKIRAVEYAIEDINFDLSSPTNRLSMEANKEAFENGILKESANRIFEFKSEFRFIEKCSINRILKEAESDGKDKLEALYEEDLLVNFLTKDKFLSDKEYSEEQINRIKEKEGRDVYTALKEIGLNDLAVKRLKTEIDLYENEKPVTELVSLVAELLIEKEEEENIEENKAGSFEEIEAEAEEQKDVRTMIDEAIHLITADRVENPDAKTVYENLIQIRREMAVQAKNTGQVPDYLLGYQYFVNDIKNGKMPFSRKTIVQEDIRLRARTAGSLEDLNLSKNEVDLLFEGKDIYINAAEKSTEEKLEMLSMIDEDINKNMNHDADEKEHNEFNMRSIYFKALEIELVKDLVNNWESDNELPEQLKETVNSERIRSFINRIEREEAEGLNIFRDNGEREFLIKWKELSK